MGDKNYERDEQAKWAKAVEENSAAYLKATDEGLDKDASRGLYAPAGDTMMLVLNTAHEAKGKIVEALGEIYQKQNERIIQMDEVDKKLLVAYAKMEVEMVKVQLMNLLELETAQMDANLTIQKVDIERRISDLDKRQAVLITLKADIEHEVNIYKAMAIEAEGLTLDARVALAQAQLATATEKLKIIDAIRMQIDAEELVLIAEQRKAAALALVLEAQERLIAIKQDMIPMQEEKAKARSAQADAITDESAWNKKIVELGYVKNDLELSQESAEERIREAENVYQTAVLALTRAQEATNIMRHRSQVTMKTNATDIRRQAIEAGLILDEKKTDLQIGKQVWQLEKEYAINFLERAAHLREITLTAQDARQTTIAEATKQRISVDYHTFGRKIAKGVFAGFTPPGATMGSTSPLPPSEGEISGDVEGI